MAPSIVWNQLERAEEPLKILDPMAGSGTTIVSAKIKGHFSWGCDTDPLALLISQAWSLRFDSDKLLARGKRIIQKSIEYSEGLDSESAYPQSADAETRQFIDFWFDDTSRIQLTALSRLIAKVRVKNERLLLWVAFSRLIITKKIGVSRAMDVSHSRPHRVYDESPIKPFDKFERALEYICKNAPFSNSNTIYPEAQVTRCDARSLPFEDNYFDMVITSPPYLNAIDYLRGHKLSLVWMGHSISSIRKLRTANVGTENTAGLGEDIGFAQALQSMGEIDQLGQKNQKIIRKYVVDMSQVINEIGRVIKSQGKAVFVIGDSLIKGVLVKNSEALVGLARGAGLTLIDRQERPLPENRRYLPPPTVRKSGNELMKRMKHEVILSFQSD